MPFEALRSDRSIAGAKPLLNRRAEIDSFDLANALDPLQLAQRPPYGTDSGYDLLTSTGDFIVPPTVKAKQRFRIERAIIAFHDPYYDRFGSQTARRNELQERLLLMASYNCDEFKRHVYQVQAEANFLAGATTTTLAGLSAIFAPTGTKTALAGAAGIISGARAEYNEAYFRRAVVEVITRAIDAELESKYSDIQTRQGQDLAKYPVTAAIKDAVDINSICTMQSGLQVASKAVSIVQDVGLDKLATLYGKSGKPADLFQNLATANGKTFESAAGTSFTADVEDLPALHLQRTVQAITDEQNVVIAKWKDLKKLLPAVETDASKQLTTQGEALVKSAADKANEALGKLNADKMKSDANTKGQEIYSSIAEAQSSTTASDQRTAILKLRKAELDAQGLKDEMDAAYSDFLSKATAVEGELTTLGEKIRAL